MGQFLRDREISHTVIDEAALSRLVDVFLSQGMTMPEYNSQQNQEGEDAGVGASLSFLIRFDEKGYRVFSKEKLLQLFKEAGSVERIIFELISDSAQQSGRITGNYADLRLDAHESVTCFLTVSSDDEGWMTACFAAIEDVLAGCRGRASSWIRHPLTEVVLQLISVVVGFIVGLWGASLAAPHLAIDNAFLITFLLFLLIFSNLWVPVGNKARELLRASFPKIRFDRPHKDKLAWFYRSIVAGMVLAVTLYLLGLLFSYAGRILGGFIAGS